MAIDSGWEEVEVALRRWETIASLKPTIAAMTRAAGILKAGLATDEVQPSVSHMWLNLGRGHRRRRVGVGWTEASRVSLGEATGYSVCFIEPSMDVTDRKIVAEADLVDVVREYLASL